MDLGEVGGEQGGRGRGRRGEMVEGRGGRRWRETCRVAQQPLFNLHPLPTSNPASLSLSLLFPLPSPSSPLPLSSLNTPPHLTEANEGLLTPERESAPTSCSESVARESVVPGTAVFSGPSATSLRACTLGACGPCIQLVGDGWSERLAAREALTAAAKA